MRKFLLYIMGVISMLSFQSCLHDDKEVFDESAAERLEHATEETKQILESSTSGWAFQYYLGDEYTSGGCTYLVKFKDGKADVALDLVDDPTDITHSSYDVVKDQGPVLTFNTYNEWMHYFANPKSDGTTNGGDFEFTVMKISNDTIDLKGRTTGNKMRLIRLPENTDWSTYFNAIYDFEDNMFDSYRVMEDGVEQGVVSFNSRRYSYVASDKSVVRNPYCVTPNGIAVPVAFADDAHNFVQKDGELDLTATDVASGKSLVLQPLISPSYVIKNVGATVALNDEAQTKEIKLNMANAFTYTSDADWLTINASENGLTLNVTANNEGHPRQATVKVANENGEGEFIVSQMECAKDIFGTYLLQYYDGNGNVCQSTFDVTADNADAIDMPINCRGYTLHATLKWNDETLSFDWSSFQYLGGVTLTSGTACSVYNIFVGDQYWSALSTNFTYSAPVSYDAENGTYAIFSEGEVNGEQISSVYLEACNPNPASSNDILGYLDIMQSPVLVRIPADETGAARVKGMMKTRMLCNKVPAFHANPVFGKKFVK